jgi:hypothetical protein
MRLKRPKLTDFSKEFRRNAKIIEQLEKIPENDSRRKRLMKQLEVSNQKLVRIRSSLSKNKT